MFQLSGRLLNIIASVFQFLNMGFAKALEALTVYRLGVLVGLRSAAFAGRVHTTLTRTTRLTSPPYSALPKPACMYTCGRAMDVALANVDCRIAQVHEVDLHSIFYCEIAQLRSSVAKEGSMYFNRAYYRLGESLKMSRDTQA